MIRPSAAPFALLACLALACGPAHGGRTAGPESGADSGSDPDPVAADREDLAEATFAGGCFWCMEPPFDALEGVVSTTSGYTGGEAADPSYEEVSSGGTGHVEAVRVLYDSDRVSYEELLHVFWRNIDPTDAGGQFCDRGDPYRTGVFVHSEEQRRLAEASREEVRELVEGELVTPVEAAGPFYAAEEYHQDYYEKNPIRYKLYRTSCRRDARLRELWGAEAGGVAH